MLALRNLIPLLTLPLRRELLTTRKLVTRWNELESERDSVGEYSPKVSVRVRVWFRVMVSLLPNGLTITLIANPYVHPR
jgi:hypothetical protein